MICEPAHDEILLHELHGHVEAALGKATYANSVQHAHSSLATPF